MASTPIYATQEGTEATQVAFVGTSLAPEGIDVANSPLQSPSRSMPTRLLSPAIQLAPEGIDVALLIPIYANWICLHWRSQHFIDKEAV